MRKRFFYPIFVGLVAIGVAGLLRASHWWERSYATLTSTEVSPEGCFELREFSPFWILPSAFHPYTHDGMTTTLRPWGQPVLYRLYDSFTGELLGESPILDAYMDDTEIAWDSRPIIARRRISVGFHQLAETDRCSSLEMRGLARTEINRRRIQKGQKTLGEIYELKRPSDPSRPDVAQRPSEPTENVPL